MKDVSFARSGAGRKPLYKPQSDDGKPRSEPRPRAQQDLMALAQGKTAPPVAMNRFVQKYPNLAAKK